MFHKAGTLVVWDVDPIAKRVSVYRPGAPGQPVHFGPGEIADAEPAVPGWRMAVDRIFASAAVTTPSPRRRERSPPAVRR